MNAVEVRPAPFEWLETDPEDRKYWVGSARKPGSSCVGRRRNYGVAFDSAKAALPYVLDPIQATRKEVDEIAASSGLAGVEVKDEHFRTIEEWPLA